MHNLFRNFSLLLLCHLQRSFSFKISSIITDTDFQKLFNHKQTLGNSIMHTTFNLIISVIFLLNSFKILIMSDKHLSNDPMNSISIKSITNVNIARCHIINSGIFTFWRVRKVFNKSEVAIYSCIKKRCPSI
jgi:hypothetical protein